MRNLKKILLISWILLGLSYALNAQVQSNSRLAFEYYNSGEYEKAASIFLEMYTQNKAKPYLNYYIRCLIEMDEFSEAEKELKKAIRQTKDVSIYVDLAYVLELNKDKKGAEEYLEKPFQEFPSEVNQIRALGNAYITYQKLDQAHRTYAIGRSILADPNEFRLEMASLYRMQRRHPEMLDEYLALLLYQPTMINTVESYLLSALTSDIDENLLELTRTKTLAFAQQFPGYPVFSELLIWVYTQQKEFDLAVDQAISLDIRNRNTGLRTINLARAARQDGDYISAIRAYQFVIDQGEATSETGALPANPQLSALSQAIIEINQTKLEKLEMENASLKDFLSLNEEFTTALNQLNDQTQKAVLFKEKAYIHIFHLQNQEQALALIDSALNLAVRDRQLYVDCMMDKADYHLAADDPWTATLLYARIDKENKDTDPSSLAKLKKAQVAFYSNDFDWAVSQLDVLKGSTSKLIANDAFELALSIKENKSEQDTANHALMALAKIHYLIFQRNHSKTLATIDSVIADKSLSIVHDDALFIKAELLNEMNQNSEAASHYREILKESRNGIWGHKALFRLGVLLFDDQQYDEAIELFMQLVQEFPNSFYNLDARNYVRKIKNLPPQGIPS